MFGLAVLGCSDTDHRIPDLLSNNESKLRGYEQVGGRGIVP